MVERVYCLTVGSDVYAVKEMRNPWEIAHWREWLDEAWRFELRAIDAGIVAPPPVPATDGSCLAEVARRGGGSCSVRLHHWLDGTPAPLGPATRELASWAGETLARLHALRVAPANRSVFPTLNTLNAERWPLWSKKPLRRVFRGHRKWRRQCQPLRASRPWRSQRETDAMRR